MQYREMNMVMVRGRLLAGVMVGLMVLFMVTACGGTGSENVGQNPENLSPTTTTAEYLVSGAIAEAKALETQDEDFQFFKKEASQFGLHLLSSDEDEYKQIRNRLLTNDELASALKIADTDDVIVQLKRKFLIGTGYVLINIEATDREIIEFLITATPEARARKVAFDELKEEASQFGLLYLSLVEEEEYKQIRNRLLANDELASALRTAYANEVSVHLDRRFRVGTGFVFINVDATNQEIIDFLLGK